MRHTASILIAGIALMAGAMFASQASARCPTPRLTPPEDVKLNSDAVLIVTHATAMFDPRYATKHGVDAAVKFAKEKRIPVVYLIDDSPIQHYMMEDCNPDYWVYSADGEINFKVRPAHVYLAGGHLELCLSRTANDILWRKMQRKKPEVHYTFFMDAIYLNGKSVEQTDPYYEEFSKFMSVVTYGRPGGEAGPRLSLLEVAGAIKDMSHQYSYLKKVVPRWERSVPEGYEVDLVIAGFSREVLRSGRGLFPPLVDFTFVDSADSLK